jgi:hypothetical protein
MTTNTSTRPSHRVYAVTRKGADDKGRRTGPRKAAECALFCRDLLIRKLH